MREPDEHAATCALSLDAATLSAARDELLPADELRRVRAHTPTCLACQEHSAAFDGIAHALLAQPELEPGDRIVARVLASSRDASSSSSASDSSPVVAPAHPRPSRVPRLPRLPRPWRRLPRARRWGGLAALVAVAAVLLLFVYVLGSGLPLRGPTAHATPAHSPLATAYPTPTPLPNSPLWNIQQAWGTGGVAARLSTQLDPAHIFEAHAITPDGRTLIGLVFTVAGDGSLVTASQAQTGMLDVTTQQFTPFGVSAPVEAPPGYVSNDGRFVILFDDTQPGATCGICHRRYWSYDLATHQLREIGVGVNLTYASHGTAILVPVLAPTETIEADDLATGVITLIVSGTAALEPVPLGFGWPYLLYTEQATGGSRAFTPVHVFNAQSGADTTLPASTSSALISALSTSAFALGVSGLEIMSDTLIYASTAALPASATGNAVSSVRAFSSCPQCTPTPDPPGQPAPSSFNQTTIYALAHFLDPSAQPRQVAAFVTGSGDAISLFPAGDTVFVSVVPDPSMPGNANRATALYALDHATDPATRAFALLASYPQLGTVKAVNDRLVTFGGQLVYDRAEGRLVELTHSSPLGSGVPVPGTDLAGSFLLVANPISRNVPSAEQVTIYNTTLLPIQSG